MAILDAMSYSIPVIATPVGGTTDVFKDEFHLLIFSPGNINQLSQKLQRLIDDKELRNYLAANSGKIVREEFAPLKIAARVDQLYHSLSIREK